VANLLHQLQVQWLATRGIQREYHFAGNRITVRVQLARVPVCLTTPLELQHGEMR
jgi:hypothetical protein